MQGVAVFWCRHLAGPMVHGRQPVSHSGCAGNGATCVNAGTASWAYPHFLLWIPACVKCEVTIPILQATS